MKMRILSFMLCCLMVFSLLPAFGTATTALKKVVIVQESKDATSDGTQKSILAALSKAGYVDKKNISLTQIQMNGDVKKSASVVAQIKKLKPAVVIVNSATTTNTTVGKALDGSGIPTIVCVGVDTIGVVTANGVPKGNVTGFNLTPKDLQKNAFSLLNKIVPAKGKKAVFLTVDGIYKKADVEKSLNAVGVKLKAYCESKYMDDFKTAVRKYNNDPEVAWMLVGIWPGVNKDGTGSQFEMGKWDVSNRAKPSCTYWTGVSDFGMLLGLGIDLNEVGTQAGEMATKILKGEKIKTIKAQDPRKILIELNQKTADRMKIKIPASILGSASKISKAESWYDVKLVEKK